MRLRLARWVMIAVVVWAAFALAVESRRTARIYAFDAEPPTFAERWRVGSPDWRYLAELAWWVEREIPAGSTVVFRTEPPSRMIAWSFAYLLPRHEVIPDGPGALAAAGENDGYAVAFRADWLDRRLVPILDHPDGHHLYRRQEPPGREP